MHCQGGCTIILVRSLKSMCIPIGCYVNELLCSLMSAMYGLMLFIVVLQELPNCLHVDIIRTMGSSIGLHLPVFEIASVLSEGVYCCFTRTTLMFTGIILCIH